VTYFPLSRTFQCYLLQGIKNIDVEVYDECTFSQDPLIAHGMYHIPEEVIKRHEVVDDWFPLSGNEGDGKEGTLHLILSLQPILPGQPLAAGPQVRVAPNLAAGHKPMAYQTAYLSPQRRPHQEQHQPPPLKPLSDEEIDEFLKMFPNLDREIIMSVHVASNGNKESMVNSLLQLGQQ
jgi:toll-interacting protein